MSFNLIQEAWIPVRRKDGTRLRIAPWQVTSEHDKNPIVELDAPRPDFNGALIQFLIGLVQTAMAPDNDRQWRESLIGPPDERKVKAALFAIVNAFDLNGPGPRFMQDLNLKQEDGESKAIDLILIDAPGEMTVKKARDHFTKRDRVLAECPSCSAMALLTLQINAPSGGVGHRTSLRGGGPLTTVVMGDTLWQTIWLNVLTKPDFIGTCGDSGKQDISDIFPWMGPTKTSEKGQTISPVDVHPAHMFWAMPRRIGLIFEESRQDACDLCGQNHRLLVRQYTAKNYGNNYKGAWRHPLTPYHNAGEDSGMLSIKADSSVKQYRHWMGWVLKSEREEPARVAHEFLGRQSRWPKLHETLRQPARLWACGYDMDNMKARNWCDSIMPLHQAHETIRADLEKFIRGLLLSAQVVEWQLGNALRHAVCGKPEISSAGIKWTVPEQAKGNKSLWTNVAECFWHATEENFYGMLRSAQDAFSAGDANGLLSLRKKWLELIRHKGRKIFDDFSQYDQISLADPKRITLAREEFWRFSGADNKKIREALDLSATQVLEREPAA
ncbi:MAG: type I-E CRISPR-associated protein Cse1/CasA [Elusimicrobia bacterium]|nr:type I-E CRISPR-associated protein Cse1/CasA [Elusimicrobiota bacterium]